MNTRKQTRYAFPCFLSCLCGSEREASNFPDQGCFLSCLCGSEHNLHKSEDLRLLQIWIIPPFTGLPRLYGSHQYKEEERQNRLLNIVSSQNGDSKIKIYQDINIFVSELDKELDFKIKKDRQVYFVQIEGSSNINGTLLENGDAMEIVDEDILTIKPITKSHILFIEMQKK